MISLIRLLLDFGMLVLIWLVQRIIYPSFLHYSDKQLLHWHAIYTKRFSYIVITLMLGQLGVSIYQLFMKVDLYTILSLSIIIVLWVSTFIQFVPIHSQISKGHSSSQLLNSLIQKNWIRTILWTLMFLMGMIYTII